MIRLVRQGQRILRVPVDIISSPSYSRDIAAALRELIDGRAPCGLYHVANQGSASLYDLMVEISRELALNVVVEKASSKEYPSVGRKNIYTPIASEKLKPLRPWQEAVKEFCGRVRNKKDHS
jgi:dTDP-4-dehydrorhamnose reductase